MLFRAVKPWIKRIEVLAVQSILYDSQGFTETGGLK